MSVASQIDLTGGELVVEAMSYTKNRGPDCVRLTVRDGDHHGYITLWLTPEQALELQAVLAEATAKAFEQREATTK